MSTILDYIAWRGDIPLSVSPFNEVDNLLLAELSFLNFNGIVPPPELSHGITMEEAARVYFARHEGHEIDMGVLVPDKIPNMFCAMANTVRFSKMRLNSFLERMDPIREQQFAALTIDVGDGSIYVAFRGTDDTLIGWKEDLNLSFLDRIPSQEEALRYLTRIARQYKDRPIRVGGHSKGGNLAVFSAVHAVAATQDRILAVYNNDGPGFFRRLIGTPEHTRIAKKILTIVPQSSIVGQLLEHEENVQVVHSFAEGMLQHDGFSWEVRGTEFVHLEDFSQEGKVFEGTMDAWAASLSVEQREAFADALYEVLTGTGAKTLSELNEEKLKSAVAILKTYQNLDRETRRALTGALWLLVQVGAKNVAQNMGENNLEPLRKTMKKKTAPPAKNAAEKPKRSVRDK